MPDAKTPEIGLISLQTAAKLLMLSDEHIRRLVKERWIEREAYGKYRLVAVVQGYIRYLKGRIEEASKSAAANREDDARTREIELRIAERDRRLIDTEEHCAILDEVLGIVRTGLAGISLSEIKTNEAMT